MNTFRSLITALALALFLASSVSAAPPPPSTPPLVTPIKTEGNNKDVRRAYYRIGKTEVKATIAQMGGQQHFTLWEGKTNVFHFSAPTSKLFYGDMGAFTSGGQTFFYYYANTRIGWRAPGARLPPGAASSSASRRSTARIASMWTVPTTTTRTPMIFSSPSALCSSANTSGSLHSISAPNSFPISAA